MSTQPLRPVLLILGMLPVLVLVSWPGAGTSTMFQLFVVAVVAALFFATYPRGRRAWPACTLAGAGVVYYVLVVEAPAGSLGRLVGAILAGLLALVAVGPTIYSSVRDSLQAVGEARRHSAEALARLRQEDARRRHQTASIVAGTTDTN